MMKGQRQELLQFRLNEAERDRLIDVFAEGPLEFNAAVDPELLRRGWIHYYEMCDGSTPTAIDAAVEANWFYDSCGAVHSWL